MIEEQVMISHARRMSGAEGAARVIVLRVMNNVA